MRKAVILLVLMLVGFQFSVAQITEQIIANSVGKCCKVNLIKKEQIKDELKLTFSVEWLDKNLNPVADSISNLVLTPSDISSNMQNNLKCTNFLKKTSISFNSKGELVFKLHGEIITENIDIKLDFGIDKPISELNNSGELIFKRPKSFTYPVTLDLVEYRTTFSTPPDIKIIYPISGNDQVPVVEKQAVNIIGEATDESGINLLLVNSNDVYVNPDGKFQTVVNLLPGNNSIKIMAIDNDGSITEKNIIIECRNFSIASSLVEDGKYYALLIAVENYEDPEIYDLNNATDDAKAIYNVLTTQYTFEEGNVKMLIDPNREEMVIALDKLVEEITAKDNLLIFYAGHGFWSEKANIGYWLPSDAKKANTANWFRNSTVRDYISSIQSKHTLLIADACFSGGIFKTRKAFGNSSLAIEKLYNLPSRKAMTSGTIEEVPDKSVFVEYLIKRLNENEDLFLPSETLFSSFKTAVMNNSPNIPQFGEINNTGDEGGDFIFIRK